MKFECADLDRALRNPELMPDAREHLKCCSACRREYQLWADISIAAKELHCDWESPTLWDNIKVRMAVQNKPRRRWWFDMRALALAASTAAIGVGLFVRSHETAAQPHSRRTAAVVTDSTVPATQGFLTDQALQEVERNEAAYVHSINKLSRLAEPKLERPASALSAAYREKLAVLDSAILETRANLAQNRFNVRLQTELAGLYTEKQQTLREFLTGESHRNNN